MCKYIAIHTKYQGLSIKGHFPLQRLRPRGRSEVAWACAILFLCKNFRTLRSLRTRHGSRNVFYFQGELRAV